MIGGENLGGIYEWGRQMLAALTARDAPEPGPRVKLWRGRATAYFVMRDGCWIKHYLKGGKVDRPVWVTGVAAACHTADGYRFYVSLDSDSKMPPSIERLEREGFKPVYYRIYRRPGRGTAAHLIVGPPHASPWWALHALARYDDPEHRRMKRRMARVGMWHNFGVIRVTPLDGEVDVVLHVDTRDPLGRLIGWIRDLRLRRR